MGAHPQARRLPGGTGPLSDPVVAPALVARILPDVSGVEKVFDYAVPPALRESLGIGMRVRVALQGRRIAGWVVAIGEPDPSLPAERLRPVLQVVGQGPPTDVVELSEWAARRWCGPRRSILVAASPPRVVRHVPSPRRFAPTATWSALGEPWLVDLVSKGGGLLRWPPTWDLLRIIASAHRAGPVLVVAPSVAQADLLARRAERLGVSTAVLPRDWTAAAGGVDVVFGARSAVWGPCAGLGAMVVLDEHDEAHHEERSPTWWAPAVAAERARRTGVPLVVVSPCPTVAGQVHHGLSWRPSREAEREAWPVIDVVDVADRPPWERSPLTDTVRRYLADASCRVVCVSNTTGQARLLACRGCGDIVRCSQCDAAVGQLDDLTLACRRCGGRRPPVCIACASSALTVLRPGLARLRRDVEAAARRPVLMLTSRDSGPDDAMNPWSEFGVVLGTEAALHRVRRADAVVFCDLDAEVLAPRYRAEEQVQALVARAARLVGPRAQGGRVIIQTALVDHPLMRALATVDLSGPVPAETARRREQGWPPFTAVATVEGTGADLWMSELRRAVADHPAIMVTGPADGRYLVRASHPDELAEALTRVPRPARSRCRVVVDPPRL